MVIPKIVISISIIKNIVIILSHGFFGILSITLSNCGLIYFINKTAKTPQNNV